MTRKGDPCKAPVIGPDGYCSNHTPDPERRARAAEQKVEASASYAKKRAGLSQDLLVHVNDKIMENVDMIWASYAKAIQAGDWRAAEALMNRVYGRPKEGAEAPKDIDKLELASPEEREAMLRRIIASNPGVEQSLDLP